MGLHEFFYYGKPEPKPVSRNLLKAFEDEREILVRLVLDVHRVGEISLDKRNSAPTNIIA